MTGDRTLVPVPLPEVTTGRAGMRWAALSGLDSAVPRGYFMGPANPPAERDRLVERRRPGPPPTCCGRVVGVRSAAGGHDADRRAAIGPT